MRVFGIEPGSARTGYGCIDADGSRCRLVAFGAITASSRLPFPDRLTRIFDELTALLAANRPTCVAVEGVFSARNASSALKLGQARGAALVAASKAGLQVAEYAPSEVKRAVVGYGRADKQQVQQMIMLLLGLDAPPTPHDASDALAIAVCHAHTAGGTIALSAKPAGQVPRSWRRYRPEARR